MPDLVRICAVVLAATFAWAAAAKVGRPRTWRAALEWYGLPSGAIATAAVLVPPAEAAVAALALFGATRAGAALALALLALFSLALARAGLRGRRRMPCGCFGRARERDLRLMLARNSALAVAAAAVIASGEDGSLLPPLALPGRAEIVPAALILVGIAVGAWAAWQTARSLSRREGR